MLNILYYESILLDNMYCNYLLNPYRVSLPMVI
nr:MAG TPA: hypothetical protein [Caudoviricetes sp.]DAP01504.1 MAG TPA: hypothetical protein [Caudoviricetes sp.]